MPHATEKQNETGSPCATLLHARARVQSLPREIAISLENLSHIVAARVNERRERDARRISPPRGIAKPSDTGQGNEANSRSVPNRSSRRKARAGISVRNRRPGDPGSTRGWRSAIFSRARRRGHLSRRGGSRVSVSISDRTLGFHPRRRLILPVGPDISRGSCFIVLEFGRPSDLRPCPASPGPPEKTGRDDFL